MKKVRIAFGVAAALTPAALTLAPGAANAATRSGGCSNQHWMHFQNRLTGTSKCFGFNGGTWTGHFAAGQICGGNNWGWYSGTSSNGGHITHATFHQGSTYANLPDLGQVGVDQISKVHISNWKGSQSCF